MIHENDKTFGGNEQDQRELYEGNDNDKDDIKKFINRLAIQRKLLEKFVDPTSNHSEQVIENEENPNNQNSN